MRDLVISKMEDILYKIAYNQYQEMYSSMSYGCENKYLEFSIAPLISLASDLNIEISGVRGCYCGNTVFAHNYLTLEEQLERM